MVTWHPPRYTLLNRTWGGPACSLGILRAAHSGIRTWGGPACSLGILRAAHSGIRTWGGPACSWSQVLGDDAFLEHEVRPGLHLARLHDAVGAGHTLVEAEPLPRL